MSAMAFVGAGCSSYSGAGNQAPSPAPQTVLQVDTVFVEAPAPAMAIGVDIDTVRAGRFDNGKMWTFEYPPLDYFRETYGFAPDSSWFVRARVGALRLPNCTASFVSPNGLVLTNHHCARESVTKVARDGERLLDEGFYAATFEEERPVEDFWADQLINIVDVTDEVHAAVAGQAGAARAQALQAVEEHIAQQLTGEHGGEDAGIVVELISLWDGAKYSAYVFRRFSNLSLVMAPELQIGYFGGDPDNFTYPRYNLDMSFFRVYDENGQPYRPEHFFTWSEAGVEEGDAVFIIGNPGSTSRLQTVAQLEFRRAVADKAILDLITSRVTAMQAFYDAHPEEGDAVDLRNTIFSLLNSEKAYTGIWEGLHDPVTMAKRRDAEEQFQRAIEADPSLRDQYGGLIRRMEEIQEEKAELGPHYSAFLAMTSPNFTSATLRRALFGYQYLMGRDRGAPPQALAGVKEQFTSFGDQPRGLQAGLLSARLAAMTQHFGNGGDMVTRLLNGRTPETVAHDVIAQSVLADSASAVRALEDGTLTMDDPALRLVDGFLEQFGQYQAGWGGFLQEEENIAAQLGRARFDVYGTSIPPDATFSLRIADGVVRGFEYNGTVAPVYTTFYGLYDRYYSYGAGTEWDLPDRWLNPPSSFDMSKPVNFVSTLDIIGGNSGSPVVNSDLEVVGLAFDGNIESLPGDYIYLPDVNRAVSVDVRGMLEALEDIYDAGRIVEELKTGRLANR
jgi:hypothetical protein